MLRVLFAGTPEVAVPSLRMLVKDTEHFEVVAVLTRPDAPTGRGRKIMPSPVKMAARELGLDVIECDPADECFLSALKATGAQCAAVVAYGKILRESVLEALPLGWYNLHFSLLPQWRGAAPVQRAIWAGDEVTGCSVFRITAGMDRGPVLGQSTVTIGAHENAGELLHRLAEDGTGLLAASLQALDEGVVNAVDQPAGSYDVAAKITTQDARMRFDVPAFALDRQIRACTPVPGAWANLHPHGDDASETLHVSKAIPADMTVDESPRNLKPGELHVTKHHVWVGTSTDPLELLVVKAAGKREMGAPEWARGAHLAEGAYLD